jgi:hypothetical protein
VAATAFAGALAADVSVVDLDPPAGGAEFVTTVALDHGLHRLMLKPAGSVGRDPKPPAQLDVGYSLLALAKQMQARNHTRIGSLVPCRTVPAISDVWYRHRRH